MLDSTIFPEKKNQRTKIAPLTALNKTAISHLGQKELLFEHTAGVSPEQLLPLDQLAISWITAANQDSKISPESEKKFPEILTLVSRIQLKCSEQCE